MHTDQVIRIETPVRDDDIKRLKVGDQIEIYGKIFTGRDAVLPVLKLWIERGELSKLGLSLDGSIIMHAGFSVAGFGPTTSNKEAIEQSIPALSSVGVKIHVGKGSLSEETAKALKRFNSVFVVTPPVTALLMETVRSKRVVAFKNEGMEALHEVEVEGLPAIVAIAHGKSIFGSRKVE